MQTRLLKCTSKPRSKVSCSLLFGSTGRRLGVRRHCRLKFGKQPFRSFHNGDLGSLLVLHIYWVHPCQVTCIQKRPGTAYPLPPRKIFITECACHTRCHLTQPILSKRQKGMWWVSRNAQRKCFSFSFSFSVCVGKKRCCGRRQLQVAQSRRMSEHKRPKRSE